MKDYVLKDVKLSSPSKDSFLTGLVFGFDVGTGSIGENKTGEVLAPPALFKKRF